MPHHVRAKLQFDNLSTTPYQKACSESPLLDKSNTPSEIPRLSSVRPLELVAIPRRRLAAASLAANRTSPVTASTKMRDLVSGGEEPTFSSCCRVVPPRRLKDLRLGSARLPMRSWERMVREVQWVSY